MQPDPSADDATLQESLLLNTEWFINAKKFSFERHFFTHLLGIAAVAVGAGLAIDHETKDALAGLGTGIAAYYGTAFASGVLLDKKPRLLSTS